MEKGNINLELKLYLVDTPTGYYILDPEDKHGVIHAMNRGSKVIPLFQIVTPTKQQ